MKKYTKKARNIFFSDNLFRSVNKEDRNSIKVSLSKKMFPVICHSMQDTVDSLFKNVVEAMKNGQ